ncbi:MAG: hypothetical protein ACOZIN_00795 [Myxococcota bacterium]
MSSLLFAAPAADPFARLVVSLVALGLIFSILAAGVLLWVMAAQAMVLGRPTLPPGSSIR